MVDFWAYRRGSALWPVDGESAEIMAKLQADKPMHIEAKMPRNARHHRKFFKLVNVIANGIGCSPLALRRHLLKRTGHVVAIKMRDGFVIEYPASISFASMDQTEFNEFYNQCVDIIVTDLGIRRPDILEQVKDLIDGDMADAIRK